MLKIKKYLFIIAVIALSCSPHVQSLQHIRFGSSSDPLNGLTITWQSKGTADKIQWGYTPACEMGDFQGIMRPGNAKNLFDYLFLSVKANASIYYKIYDSHDKAWSEVKKYKTASPVATDNYSFIALGDSRSFPEDWRKTSDAANTRDVDLVLFTGDAIVDGSDDDKWDRWFNYGRKFLENKLVYYTIGNCEVKNKGTVNYLNNFIMPVNPSGSELYYSFNYGNALFICLNSYDADSQTQSDWLINTLRNSNQTWKFVFFHQPFYATGSHAGEMKVYLKTWWKAFDDYGVDVIFNGHAHCYQRSKPINRNVSTTTPVTEYGSCANQGRCEIICGRAGAPSNSFEPSQFVAVNRPDLHYTLIKVNDRTFSLEAYDANNQLFDRFSITKKPCTDS
jgi:predicted phosphodiesterase